MRKWNIPWWLAAAPLTAAAFGNLEPNAAQIEKGRVLLDWAHKAYDAPDLSPPTLERALAVKLVYRDADVIKDATIDATRWSFDIESLPDGPQSAEYEVAAGFLDNNGPRMSFWVDDARACIREVDVKRALGEDFRSGSSTMRHYPPGQSAPPGIRATHESMAYKHKISGRVVVFGFDFVCVSNVYIRDPQPVDWRPDKRYLQRATRADPR